VWKDSECDRGDLGAGGKRLEWCRRQECGEHISEEEAGCFKDPPDAVSRVREALHTETRKDILHPLELTGSNNHFGSLHGTGCGWRRQRRHR